MRMTLGEIAEAADATLVRGRPESTVEGVSTDTRTLKQGDLFVALKGGSFDGHDFVDEAVSGGAAAVLVEAGRAREEYPGETAVLGVPDTLTALGDVAGAYRSRFSMPFVGITGSNGKTTTKEMVAHVLRSRGKVVAAKKSFNNFIGLPLTVFDVTPDATVVVLEMGTSARGEITRLCEIGRPQIGVITNVGPTHLEKLQSIEGVAAAKAELLDGLPEDGTAILNADDEWCRKLCRIAGRKGKLVTFGTSADADIRAGDVHQDTEGLSFVTNERVRVELSVPGRHNVANALAAIAVCRRLGMKMNEVAERLASFTGTTMRMEVVRVGGLTVINDAYNANPVNMAAALEEFKRYRTSGTRHFVCGDMLELGEQSAGLHRELGVRIAESDIDRLWLFGSEVNATRTAAVEAGFDADAIFLSDDYERFETRLLEAFKEGDVVLLKGSRGMRLERVLEALLEKGSDPLRPSGGLTPFPGQQQR